jgi:Helix-hairpin-helix domain/Fingers domain of DNA polymerase lambda
VKCRCPASVGSISMSTTFQLTSTTHALIPEKCAGELFLKWSKLLEVPELVDERSPEGSKSVSKEFRRNVKIVKSDWIVESLKAKKILCSEPYLHSLQLPPPAAPDAVEQPAQQSRTDITPRIISSPSSSYGPKYRNPEGEKGHPFRGRPGPDGSTKRDLEDPLNSEKTEVNHVSHQTSTTNDKGEKAVYDVIIPTNKNTHITDILKQMVVFYDLLGDNFREMVYNRCCGVLETYHKKIEDVSEVTMLPGVGKSLRDKISEILKTGKLEKLELLKKDVHLSAVVDLGRIWGMGPKGAQNLYNLGFRCVGDVKDRGLDVLTPQQRIGTSSIYLSLGAR